MAKKNKKIFTSRHRTTRHSRQGSLISGFGDNSAERSASSHSTSTFTSPIQDGHSAFQFAKFLPTDRRSQNQLNRRVYYYDAICGGAVDLKRLLPWGEFEFTDVKDPQVRQLFEDAIIDGLDMVKMMPLLCGEFLVIGRVTASRVFNPSLGYWDNMIIHNDDYVTVHKPVFSNRTPKIDIIPSPALRAFATSTDPRDVEDRESVSSRYIELLRGGSKIPLEPLNTSYAARQLSVNDYLGHSLFERVMHIILYEQAILASTMQSALRKMGRILHVTVGDGKEWQPTSEDLANVSYMFMDAESDPNQSVLATGPGIEVNEVGVTHQEVSKLPDEIDWITQVKMLALGTSEGYLSGDASLDHMEAAMSIGVESLRALRDYLTDRFILDAARDLAHIHDLKEVKTANLGGPNTPLVKIATNSDTKYIVPRVQWKRSLQPVGDEAMFDVLQRAKEEGLPVPMRMWATAAGVNMDELLESMPQDIADRKKVFESWSSQLPGDSDGGGVFGSVKIWDASERFGSLDKKTWLEVKDNPERLASLSDSAAAAATYLMDREGGRKANLTTQQAAQLTQHIAGLNKNSTEAIAEMYRITDRSDVDIPDVRLARPPKSSVNLKLPSKYRADTLSGVAVKTEKKRR